ncbi:hypothetical protein CONLIGDRAFT_57866 [Coniochaeta ligniaria NRRL 30616]|uniref:Uncharacterized protein n=1 Tax=Coniochaeta ligniaria NRRL 30616 TaxID=1408157 RepID=A0A1J7JZ51_9PEZI|nr:hypothetical protein CONLIGDRAFT_57866 [Coniochaeta ligniaria NRRL 30616]
MMERLFSPCEDPRIKTLLLRWLRTEAGHRHSSLSVCRSLVMTITLIRKASPAVLQGCKMSHSGQPCRSCLVTHGFSAMEACGVMSKFKGRFLVQWVPGVIRGLT